jgi:ribosomal small subunit protein bTHX
MERDFDIQRRNKMGKGDQRTRRGKLFRGSHGKTRPGRNKKKKGSKKP